MNRRRFLRTVAAGTIGSTLLPLEALAWDETRLVILHTNDTHSRIDPFPEDGGRNSGLGGVARRAALIKRIRAAQEHVLLLDSGDIFQGTPYFNFYHGEVEFKAMSAMGYDVATLGNHDFDNAVDGFVAMQPHANWQWVSANYDVAGSGLEPYVKPFTIRRIAGIQVGIFGIGIDFDGLVLAPLHEGVSYNDAILSARSTAEELRQQGCDLVVCLSHLGHFSRGDRPSDHAIAREVPEVDIVLGGHSHTFLDEPEVVQDGARTRIVNQVGFAGIRLGRLDLIVDRDGRTRRWFASTYDIDRRLDYV
ncbi:MAG: metallophosphatase [Rhodothermales bacterium]|nr:metallophosphatase [Rhodothermales bacterium]MBO6781189.1 metallophosphatase [Rhodothermales bacterium]